MSGSRVCVCVWSRVLWWVLEDEEGPFVFAIFRLSTLARNECKLILSPSVSSLVPGPCPILPPPPPAEGREEEPERGGLGLEGEEEGEEEEGERRSSEGRPISVRGACMR